MSSDPRALQCRICRNACRRAFNQNDERRLHFEGPGESGPRAPVWAMKEKPFTAPPPALTPALVLGPPKAPEREPPPSPPPPLEPSEWLWGQVLVTTRSCGPDSGQDRERDSARGCQQRLAQVLWWEVHALAVDAPGGSSLEVSSHFEGLALSSACMTLPSRL